MRWLSLTAPPPEKQSAIISVGIRIRTRIRIRRRGGVAGGREPTAFGRHTLGQLKAIYKK